ncbi:MAG: hypothetical protein WA880_11680, partial [Ornithinimicrobium sp.]
ARDGIEAVAQGTPTGAGAAAVAALRSKVWGRMLPLASDDHANAASGVAAGTGLAAYALGFAVPDHESRVLTRGPWTRVSLPNGEILAR